MTKKQNISEENMALVAGKVPEKCKQAIQKVNEQYRWTESQTLRQLLMLDPTTLAAYKKELARAA